MSIPKLPFYQVLGQQSSNFHIVNLNNLSNTAALSCNAQVVMEMTGEKLTSRPVSVEDDDTGSDVLITSSVQLGDLYCGHKKVMYIGVLPITTVVSMLTIEVYLALMFSRVDV